MKFGKRRYCCGLLTVVLVLLCGVFPVIEAKAGETGWASIVTHELGAGWTKIEAHAYDAGGGWQWLPEAGVWVWVYDPYADLAGMVLVEGGTLSTSNELNGTDVATFYIGRYEVTWGEWQTVRTWANANGYDLHGVGNGCDGNHPVHSVSWYDVVEWCNAKSEMEGLEPVYMVEGEVYRSGEFGWRGSHVVEQNLSANGYRLPQEAEWEFAARGGNQSNGYTYAGSNDLNAVGWYRDNSGGAACNEWEGRGTWPVGLKEANELGLYDTSGNAWEWCWDENGSHRLVRGGSWGSPADGCTVSGQNYASPDLREYLFGFRIARSSGN